MSIGNKKVKDYIDLIDTKAFVERVVFDSKCSSEAKEIFMFCWRFTITEIEKSISSLESKKQSQNSVSFLKLVLKNHLNKKVTALFEVYVKYGISLESKLTYTMDNEIVLASKLQYEYFKTDSKKVRHKVKQWFLLEISKVYFAQMIIKRINELEII